MEQHVSVFSDEQLHFVSQMPQIYQMCREMQKGKKKTEINKEVRLFLVRMISRHSFPNLRKYNITNSGIFCFMQNINRLAKR